MIYRLKGEVTKGMTKCLAYKGEMKAAIQDKHIILSVL